MPALMTANWLNNEPYYVIHRMATNGKQKGVADACLKWCFEHCNNIRVDTHHDNLVMQNILKKVRFPALWHHLYPQWHIPHRLPADINRKRVIFADRINKKKKHEDSLDRPEQFICHSSLALPALHAQIMTDPSIEWEIVSATINENTGMIVDEIYRHRPDILAATTWLFNHEQLMHVASRVKALLPESLPGAGRSGISGRQ